jgi:hypothetical protein
MAVTRSLLVASLVLPVMAIAADENFRCGKWIASSDMSVEELLTKCGEPRSRERKVEDVMARNQYTGLMRKTGETVIETWTYDRGSTAAPMVVTIIDGRIMRIERAR